MCRQAWPPPEKKVDEWRIEQKDLGGLFVKDFRSNNKDLIPRTEDNKLPEPGYTPHENEANTDKQRGQDGTCGTFLRPWGFRVMLAGFRSEKESS